MGSDISSLLILLRLIWSAESSSGPYRTRERWVYWSEVSEGPQRWYMIFDMRRESLKELNLFSLEESWLKGISLVLKYLMWQKEAQLHSMVCSEMVRAKASQDGQWVQTKMDKILPEHKKTSTERMVKQWSRLPREVVESLKIVFDYSWHHLTVKEKTCTLRDPWQNEDVINYS